MPAPHKDLDIHSQWKRKLLLAALYGVAFSIVWGGAHALTDLHTERLHWYFQWETTIPFVAAALPLYFTLDVAVALAPFAFETWRDAAGLMCTLLVQLVIAVPFFVLLPIEPGFSNDMTTGVWGAYLFEPLGLDNMSQWNHTPSLHVSYALTLALCVRCVPRWLAWTWAVCVCATTMLVHEHHLICIAGGLALFLATAPTVLPWFERRFQRPN
jgi:membrane-associated phospholipid phosphatase